MALLKPLEPNKAVWHKVLIFGVFKRHTIAESTKFRVALSVGEKNVVGYEKLKLEWDYIQTYAYHFSFVKEGGWWGTEGSWAEADSSGVYDMPCRLEVSFGDVLTTSYKFFSTACLCWGKNLIPGTLYTLWSVYKAAWESQNPRLDGVRRDLWRPPSATPSWILPEQVARDHIQVGWMSPETETPQPPWAACPRALSLSR